MNNRNLHSFQLDLDTTAKAIAVAQRRAVSWRMEDASIPDIQIASLSGISSAEDVKTFRDLGVSCCLIGETLMKSSDPAALVKELLGATKSGGMSHMFKICGITKAIDASVALQHGANFIGKSEIVMHYPFDFIFRVDLRPEIASTS